MIALPGLTLATGRHAEARGLLRTFARHMTQGMIPNRFPDEVPRLSVLGAAVAAEPEYNSVDATLWYFHALDRYLQATDDWALLDELLPLLEDSIGWHVRGTRYNTGVDVADGLLRAGTEGVQLTWMDARVDSWVVTPRSGKPVEINALWHNALRLMGAWTRRLGRDPARYDALRAAVAHSFLPRFWYPAGGYLYDVVDVDGRPGMLDWSLRPNQLIALAVAPELVPVERMRSVLSVVERELLVPLGLRTLSPADQRFAGAYGGDQRARDAAYHQGTVWPWLLGVYADAWLHCDGDAERVQRLLQPFQGHLLEAGVGTVSEIIQGAPPFAPAGCLAQAWSVAELLRIAKWMGRHAR
jgi:predicted glycogen debranching enzyme